MDNDRFHRTAKTTVPVVWSNATIDESKVGIERMKQFGFFEVGFNDAVPEVLQEKQWR